MSTTTTNRVISARNAVASAVRLGRDATPQRRRLETEKLRRSIHEALDSPTAPTAEQRQELAALLTGGGAK